MRRRDSERAETFAGYAPPTSSTTYTPNQFFDVVLPHHSRGCVRVVAFMTRQTLGWSKPDGTPQRERVAFTYAELEAKAGVGHSSIKAALEEAEAARFIRCLRTARPAGPGQVAVPALYELRWDDDGEYTTDPEKFDGFYSGNAHLTHIPNQFFDVTVPSQPLAVIRVTGSIIRRTIGFQAKRGYRRTEAALSITNLQRDTRLSRDVVWEALQKAIAAGHVAKVEAGHFDPKAGAESHAATYAIRWSDGTWDGATRGKGSRGTPKTRTETAAKEHSENPNGSTPKTRTGHSENPNGEHSENPNGTCKQHVGNDMHGKSNPKQQPDAHAKESASRQVSGPVVPAAVSTKTPTTTAAARVDTAPSPIALELIAQGGHERVAVALATAYPERCANWLRWLPYAENVANPAAYLVAAIEGGYLPPVAWENRRGRLAEELLPGIPTSFTAPEREEAYRAVLDGDGDDVDVDDDVGDEEDAAPRRRQSAVAPAPGLPKFHQVALPEVDGDDLDYRRGLAMMEQFRQRRAGAPSPGNAALGPGERACDRLA